MEADRERRGGPQAMHNKTFLLRTRPTADARFITASIWRHTPSAQHADTGHDDQDERDRKNQPSHLSGGWECWRNPLGLLGHDKHNTEQPKRQGVKAVLSPAAFGQIRILGLERARFREG